MAKRAASSVTAAGAKRAKADPVLAKVQEVVAALESADVPPAIFEMISGVIPHCLGVAKEERHRFQQDAVDVIEAELKKIEVSLGTAIETAKSNHEGSTEKLTAQNGELSKLQEALEAQKTELLTRKAALAADARVFQKAKTLRTERLAQQETGLAEATQAEASKLRVETMGKELDEVHTHTEANASAKFIKELSKHVDIDESMKTAIPSAISKAPDARGGFDAMVVQQLNSAIAKRLEELAGKIASAEPAKAALEKDVDSAEAAFQSAKTAQMTSAKAFTELQDAINSEEAKVKALQKEINALKRQDKKSADATSDAQSNLDIFKDGPWAAFEFLKERGLAKADEDMAVEAAAAVEGTTATAVAAC